MEEEQEQQGSYLAVQASNQSVMTCGFCMRRIMVDYIPYRSFLMWSIKLDNFWPKIHFWAYLTPYSRPHHEWHYWIVIHNSKQGFNSVDSQMDLDEGPQIENMECDTSEITADSTQPTTDVNTPDSKNDAPTIPDKLTKDGTMEVSESEQSCTTSQDATLSEQKLTKLGNKDGNSVTEQQSKDTPTLPQEPNVPSDTRDDTESEQKPGIDGQPSEREGVSSVVGTQNKSEKESEVKSKDSAAVAMVMEDNKDEEEEEDYTFPDSLEGFGYHFVGELVFFISNLPY